MFTDEEILEKVEKIIKNHWDDAKKIEEAIELSRKISVPQIRYGLLYELIQRHRFLTRDYSFESKLIPLEYYKRRAEYIRKKLKSKRKRR